MLRAVSGAGMASSLGRRKGRTRPNARPRPRDRGPAERQRGRPGIHQAFPELAARRRGGSKAEKTLVREGACPYLRPCPISHVPVVVCRLAGFGQEADKPSVPTGSRRRTGEPRLKRGTRLKATTDRAFSSLPTLQRSAPRRGLSFLPGVRMGLPRPIDGSSRGGFGRTAVSQRRSIRSARRRSAFHRGSSVRPVAVGHVLSTSRAIHRASG